MEIIPGVGVEAVKIGDPRWVVEQRLGPPVHAGIHTRAVYNSVDPTLVVTYDQDGAVELVEVGYGEHDQVFFDGVQLTYRFMDEVMADLAAKGHLGTPSDIGFDLQAGFAIFSMASLSAHELDPDAPDDDPRRIVEGVGIAPYSYFTDDQPPLNGTAEELEAWLRKRGVLPAEA
ncbi:hypothetical protein DLJ47_29490 [Micromonospora sp. S4605]|uniref:hypothetical protein n=1 Tax=Micromonospora sp. S4605 TaxID=1420897 RepID=UPI000D703CD9|nr:hypothetical protein [Micromonospora sp. S4605]PWU47885.1 hypothetical protein DLJ47_29490 [Micromonospora sp. S4605]